MGLLRKEDMHESFWKEGVSNPNLLINGDFQVWQRGTNFNGHAVYTADRWRFDYGGNNSYISKSNNGGLLIHTEKGYRFWIEQIIEINDNLKQHILNSDITLSFYICGNETEDMRPFVQIRKVKKDSTFDTILLSQYEYKQEGSRIVKTFNVGDMTDVVGLTIGIFRLDDTNKDTILGDKYVEFKWVKLEIGNVATKFIPRLYGEESHLCKRYYQEIVFKGTNFGANDLVIFQNYPVEMRVSPNCKIGVETEDGKIDKYGVGFIKLGDYSVGCSNTCISILHTVNSFFQDNSVYRGTAKLDAEIYY